MVMTAPAQPCLIHPSPSYHAAMKIDVALDAPLGEVAAQAERLKAAGADGAFALEANRDVMFPLLQAAGSELFVYPNVAIAFPRSPMHLAYQAWDLQRATGGRFALGLGSQIRPHIEKRFGARWDRPARQMRQYVEALKAIFATWQDGAPLDFHGDYHTLTLMTPMFLPGRLPYGLPPIWIGGLGPMMTRVAAEVADGLIVHPFNTERYLREITMPIVEEGLSDSRRSRAEFCVVVDVITCLYRNDAEREDARNQCRFNLAFYGSTPSYRVTLEVHGWQGLQEDLNALTKAGRWDEMSALVSDELLEEVCVVGTPAEAARQLRSRYAGLADRVALSLPYHPAAGLIEDFLVELRRER
jgi:probable F420-dependent oxidoreductase